MQSKLKKNLFFALLILLWTSQSWTMQNSAQHTTSIDEWIGKNEEAAQWADKLEMNSKEFFQYSWQTEIDRSWRSLHLFMYGTEPVEQRFHHKLDKNLLKQIDLAINKFITQNRDILEQLKDHHEWSEALYRLLSDKARKGLRSFIYTQYYVCTGGGIADMHAGSLYDKVVRDAYHQIITAIFGNDITKHLRAHVSLKNIPEEIWKKYPNLYTRDGDPLLFKAINTRKPEIVSQFLKIGANPLIKNYDSYRSALEQIEKAFMYNSQDHEKKIKKLFPLNIPFIHYYRD